MTTQPAATVSSDDPLIGHAEIAELAGVKRETTWEWRKRDLLPPPTVALNKKRPLWRRSVILSWLEATGRIKATPPRRK